MQHGKSVGPRGPIGGRSEGDRLRPPCWKGSWARRRAWSGSGPAPNKSARQAATATTWAFPQRRAKPQVHMLFFSHALESGHVQVGSRCNDHRGKPQEIPPVANQPEPQVVGQRPWQQHANGHARTTKRCGPGWPSSGYRVRSAVDSATPSQSAAPGDCYRAPKTKDMARPLSSTECSTTRCAAAHRKPARGSSGWCCPCPGTPSAQAGLPRARANAQIPVGRACSGGWWSLE